MITSQRAVTVLSSAAVRVRFHSTTGFKRSGSVRVRVMFSAAPMAFQSSAGKAATAAAIHLRASRRSTRVSSLFIHLNAEGKTQERGLQAAWMHCVSGVLNFVELAGGWKIADT